MKIKSKFSSITSCLLIGALSASVILPANAADLSASGSEVACATALQEKIISENIDTDVQSYSDCLNVVETYSEMGVSTDDLQTLIASDPEMALNVLSEQAVYSLTDEEVQAYVEGLLETPTTYIYPDDPEYAVTQLDNGDLQTSDGSIYPNPSSEVLSDQSNVSASSALIENSLVSPAAVTSYTTTYNSNDATGAYWVVKSTTGFKTATQRVELPTLQNCHSMDVPYVMYGVYTNGTSGDYGIYYDQAKAKWYGFFNMSCVNGQSAAEWTSDDEDAVSIPAGKAVYMYCYLTDSNWVRIRVVDNSNFSNVYYDVSVYQYGYSVPASSKIYKQITLAQKASQNGGTVNTSTGTKMLNANVVDSYLYNNTTTTKWNTTNVSYAGRSSQTYAKALTVQVNSYTPWSDENISIQFTQ